MTPDLPKVEIAIVEQTNLFRAKNSLGLVKRNWQLDLAARQFARYLAKTRKFSHTADGRKPSERISATGYKYCRISENLSLRGSANGFNSGNLAEIAVNGWKNSPIHRRNMMHPGMTEIGVGVAKTPGTHNYLSVQLFGRPDSFRYTFEIRNTTKFNVRYSLAGRKSYLFARTRKFITACNPKKLQFHSSERIFGRTDYPIYLDTDGRDRFILLMQDGKLVVSRRRSSKK